MKKKLLALVILLVSVITPLWIWFYETNSIIINYHEISNEHDLQIVFISDLHLGTFKNKEYMQKVVDLLNLQNNVDIILIGGDFFNTPKFEDVPDLLSPLADLTKPTFAVLGNHDIALPGEDYSDLLYDILPKIGVEIIEGSATNFFHNNRTFKIQGLFDQWSGKNKEVVVESENTILLMHNPDTFENISFKTTPLISLAGHTHCGQIRVMNLYKAFLPINSTYEGGLYDTQNGKLLVSCGLGESGYILGIPVQFRINNLPSIEIIQL